MKTSDRYYRVLFSIIIISFARLQTAAQPYGLNARAPIGAFLDGRLPPEQREPGKYIVVSAFPNLSFANPVGLLPVPASNRLCVHTREGRAYTFENDPNVRSRELFLDISARTQGWDDCGLLGMAFHPEFGRTGSPNRGYVYVFYQFSRNPTTGPERPPERTAAYNRLSRFTVADGARVADPDSELVLIDQYDRSVWHNGGAMFFHPNDGFLYLTLGDEGGVDGEFGNAQRLDRGLFSGVIRIDVDQNPVRSHPIRRQPIAPAPHSSRTANYFIPNDNPFVDASGNRLEEFWSIGLRSPHRMTLDPSTKRIWLGDVGQGLREEINLIVKGGNYQWAYKEGSLNGAWARPASLLGSEIPPLYEYPHTHGQSHLDGDNCVIGGYVYRGREFADELAGKYIFGDNGSGRIWALTLESDGAVSVEQIATMRAGFNYSGLSTFGIDHENELYLCQMGLDSRILKLARPQPSQNPPPLLSQTGAFLDLEFLKPAPALIPYNVNSPLWSDGANKTRWMALPNDGSPFLENERIKFNAVTEWAFPNGTVFVKHFDLAVDEVNPSQLKRLETRFLVRDSKGAVYGITYKWRPDNSEADLLSSSLSEHLSITRSQPVPAFFAAQDIGAVGSVGSTRRDDAESSHTLTTAGSRVGETSDAFHFAHQLQSGDFDVKVRIASLKSADGETVAGLMARESLAPDSKQVFIALSGENLSPGASGNTPAMFVRETTGGPTVKILSISNSAFNLPNAWLRLQRSSEQFTGFYGEDGVSWSIVATETVDLPESVHFGFAAAAPDADSPVTARFQHVANVRAQTWYYPSPRDCITCHTPFSGHVLGVRTSQLNGLLFYPSGQRDNQLRTWNHLQLFQPALSETEIPQLPKLVAVTETAAPLERRIRSYLAANCAQCHRPGGVRANFDARYETPLAQQNLVNGALFDTLAITGARVVSPGDISRSVLLQRMNILGEHQMPPLARNSIDAAAVAVIANWINTLPPVQTVRGLRAEYYDNIDFTNLKLTRTDPIVNANWATGSPDPTIDPDTFSIRWSGEIEPAFSEPYTFHTISDDGVRVWVDDQLIIDNWTPHEPTENSGTIELEAGRKYSLRVDFFEDTGEAVLRLLWSSQNQLRQVVPVTRLSAPVDPIFVLPPPLLRLQPLADGQMHLLIDAETTADYSIHATTDFREWQELFSFPSHLGTAEVTDTEASRLQHRFYRASGKE